MARPWSYTLYDLPAFAGLETVGREFNVRFRLFGGAASRLAMALWHDRRLSRTLVDLTPFASDVDLEHSGDDARTAEIQAAIDAYVVDAPWCRWSLVGHQTAAVLRARRARSTQVPLRNVVFESWRPSEVDDQAVEDLRSLSVSIQPHPRFAETEARRSETDLEIFGLLLALNAATDLAFAADAPVNVDTDAAALLLGRYIRSDDAAVLARQPHLRRRLYYLTAALVARSPRTDGPLGRILTLLNEAAPIAQLPPRGEVMVVSAALKGDSFRAPRTAGMSLTSDLGADFEAAYTIDPAFEVHGVSQAVPLQAGPAPSSGLDLLGRPREFLHLAWRAGARRPASPPPSPWIWPTHCIRALRSAGRCPRADAGCAWTSAASWRRRARRRSASASCRATPSTRPTRKRPGRRRRSVRALPQRAPRAAPPSFSRVWKSRAQYRPSATPPTSNGACSARMTRGRPNNSRKSRT